MMTEFMHPVPSSSKVQPQWRPLFKRASSTPHQAPVVTPKSKVEELTMALQRPWLNFDMGRKPSDQSQNDYVPEIFVACKLVPSFDDFLKESSAELDHILKKRPTVSPKIKINVGNKDNGETITLYNPKGDVHTTTVQSDSVSMPLGQLESDKTAEINVTAGTTLSHKSTTVRCKRKVRTVSRILANSKRRFNDLSKNLRMLYRRHKIKDCFVFMLKVPYKESFSITSSTPYNASIFADNPNHAEKLNEESIEIHPNKLDTDKIGPSDDKIDGNGSTSFENLKNGNVETTDDFQPTSEQSGGKRNKEMSILQTIGNPSEYEKLNNSSTNDHYSGNSCEETSETSKSPPRRNSKSPTLSITQSLVDTSSISLSKIGSHVESTSHTVDILRHQHDQVSHSATSIGVERSLSPNIPLPKSNSFQICLDKDLTRREKESPSPIHAEDSSVLRKMENRSPNSEAPLTKNNLPASDIESGNIKPCSPSTLPLSKSNEVKVLPEKQITHVKPIIANQILRRHSLGEEDIIRTRTPDPNGQKRSSKRVRSKSKEERRHSIEKYQERSSCEQTSNQSYDIARRKTTPDPSVEGGVGTTQNATAKNCDKSHPERGRTAWPDLPSTDLPVLIKTEPKENEDTAEPPTKKPKLTENTYVWWMARRVKKECAKSVMELNTVNFKIYSCFKCHKEFSERIHWAKHSCVSDNS